MKRKEVKNTPMKEYILTMLKRLVTKDIFKNNDLLLVTANGLIYGTPILINDVDNIDDIEMPVTQFVKAFSDIYNRDYKSDKEDSCNDSFICLKAVHIRNGNVITTLPELTVFFDQVIAVAISNDNFE